METHKGLSNLQLELLKVFSMDLSESQIREIKQLLSNYFAEKLTKDFDDLFADNSWGKEKIEEWSNEHMRTEYKA